MVNGYILGVGPLNCGGSWLYPSQHPLNPLLGMYVILLLNDMEMFSVDVGAQLDQDQLESSRSWLDRPCMVSPRMCVLCL